jgi:hypothetical protein
MFRTRFLITQKTKPAAAKAADFGSHGETLDAARRAGNQQGDRGARPRPQL